MKLPSKIVRTFEALPNGFIGSISLHSNGHGSYVLEVVYRERLKLKDDELIDAASLPLDGNLSARSVRRR